jgi:uncharacterized protein
MKRRIGLRWSMGVALGMVAVAMCGSPMVASATDQAAKKEQCSMAIFSRPAAKAEHICDEQTVRKLARRGQVFEQNQLGIASILGIAEGSDAKDALKWFEEAAHKGYAPAQVNLAVMYSNGWGTVPNNAAALHWLQIAAAQEYGRAYYNLGVFYMEGKGVSQDYAEAMRYFEKGAAAGDSRAQNNAGYLYDHGLGVKRDLAKAAEFYKQAADGGDPMGESNLADLFLRGEGVAANDAEAFRLFEKAAVQGHTGARIKLGYMYEEGRGTDRNAQAAYEWIMAATLAGDQRGQYLIKPLESKLTAEQIQRAKDRAHVLYSDKGSSQVSAQAFLQ